MKACSRVVADKLANKQTQICESARLAEEALKLLTITLKCSTLMKKETHILKTES